MALVLGSVTLSLQATNTCECGKIVTPTTALRVRVQSYRSAVGVFLLLNVHGGETAYQGWDPQIGQTARAMCTKTTQYIQVTTTKISLGVHSVSMFRTFQPEIPVPVRPSQSRQERNVSPGELHQFTSNVLHLQLTILVRTGMLSHVLWCISFNSAYPVMYIF